MLRASLLQAFYSVRSERQLMEQIDYNLLFRWLHPPPQSSPPLPSAEVQEIAELQRLLDEERATSFGLAQRLAELEGKLAGTPPLEIPEPGLPPAPGEPSMREFLDKADATPPPDDIEAPRAVPAGLRQRSSL